MEKSPSGIPIVDFSTITDQESDQAYRDLSKDVSEACENASCFYVKNHGISLDLIDNLISDFKIFFNQPLDGKMRFVHPSGIVRRRGYEPFETFNANEFMGRSGLPNDPVERFAFGPISGSVLDNVYPDYPITLKRNVQIYYEQVQLLSEKLMRVFSIASNAPRPEFFYDKCHHGEHTLKMMFYSKNASPKPMQNDRFAEHTDHTPFTILAMDQCKNSLQVQLGDGRLVYADPIPGTVFVNMGDYMAHWTNDKWRATVHKVVWPENGQSDDRVSIAFFLLINPGAVVECLPSCVEDGQKPKYESIVFGDPVAMFTKGAVTNY